MKLKILNTTLLKPHEEVDLNCIFQLSKDIEKHGIWTNPLMIDSESMIIMDGHHRHQAAQLLGLHAIPCFVLPYSSVDVYRCGTNIDFPYELIYKQVMSNQLFPCKTTKHVVKLPLPDFSISLDALRIFR